MSTQVVTAKVLTGVVTVVSTAAIGPAGPAGAAGAPGTGLSPRGEWDIATAYLEDDAVTWDGSLWQAVAASTGVEPVEGASWTLLVAKGDTGAQGEQGIPGEPGSDADIGPHNVSGTAHDDIRELVDTVSSALDAEEAARAAGDDDLASQIAATETAVAGKVAKAGDTLTGFLTAHADPENALHVATRQYVLARIDDLLGTGAPAALDTIAKLAAALQANPDIIQDLLDAIALRFTEAQGDARYQQLDADLTAIAALATTAYGRDLLTQADAAAARTYLGIAADPAAGTAGLRTLGTGATQAAPGNHAHGGGGSSKLPLVGQPGGIGVAPGLIRLVNAGPVITPGANMTIYAGPYEAGALSLAAVRFIVQAVTGTANLRFAIIALNPATWQPAAGGVVWDSGLQTYTTTGNKTLSFSAVAIPEGPYFVGLRTDNATLALSGMRMAPISGWRGLEGGWINHQHFRVAEAFGAWAGTPTPWDSWVTAATASLTGLTHFLDWGLT